MAEGRHQPPTKLILNHTESYHPCVSHNRREHAPHRRYLPSDVSVQSIHKDFMSKHGTTCKFLYDLYQKVVKDMNISFTRLGHEQCEHCESHDLHKKNCESYDSCVKWNSQVDRAKVSRQAYDKDNVLSTIVYKCIHGAAPSYLTNLCVPVATNTSRRYLRSATHKDLIVPRTRTVTYGPRSFAGSGPTVCTLRVSTTTLGQFQSGVKTILFPLAYGT